MSKMTDLKDNTLTVRFSLSSRALSLILYVLYGIFEVVRIAYIGGFGPPSFLSLITGSLILIELRRHLCKNGGKMNEGIHSFFTRFTKTVMIVHIITLSLILLATGVLIRDIPSLLVIQLMFLMSLWSDNRKFDIGRNIVRASLVLTTLYVGCILLLTRNVLVGSFAIIYYITLLCLLMKMDVSSLTIEEAKNKSKNWLHINIVSNRLKVGFLVGLIIRIIFGIYFGNHPAGYENINHIEELFSGGNPLIRTKSLGTSFYLFYVPIHLIFEFLQSVLGVPPYGFVLYSLYKIPPIIGDIMIFYALYNISYHLTKNHETSSNLSLVYFLCPYAIWLSSIVGHMDQLMIAFVLFAIMSLVKGQAKRSSIYLAVAVQFRFIPILSLPFVLYYIWKKRKKDIFSFTSVFFASLLILSIPHLYMLTTLFFTDSPAFSFLLDHWIGRLSPIGTEPLTTKFPIEWLETANFNFLRLLHVLGLWDSVSVFFGLKGFLIIYFIATLFYSMRYRRSLSIEWINQSFLFCFSLFILIATPVAQFNYMAWVIPFAFIESYLFHSIPSYYAHILWIVCTLTDPLLGNGLTYYTDLTFPFFFGLFPNRQWPLKNEILKGSVGILSALFLTVSILASFLAPLGKLEKKMKINDVSP